VENTVRYKQLYITLKVELENWPNKLSPTSIELLNQRMNQLAREIGAMDPDDSRRIELIDEISALSLISAEMKLKG